MKYEVLTIKKRFRYTATVMCTPNKWYEIILTRRKSNIKVYTGTRGIWFDQHRKIVPAKLRVIIDAKFDEQYRPIESGVGRFLHNLFAILSLISKSHE